MKSLFLALLLILPVSAAALAGEYDLIPKTPLDYTMDDGIMDKEEMQMEAQDVYKLCQINAYQKKLFNCACLAGAFLQQREKLGPTAMQFEIFDMITNSPETSSSCANTADIAGRTYQSCLTFAKNWSPTEFDPDNEDVCSCTANKVAREFARTPRLNPQYIQILRSNAMKFCSDPVNRKQQKAQAAQEDRAAKAAQSNAVVPLVPLKGTN